MLVLGTAVFGLQDPEGEKEKPQPQPQPQPDPKQEEKSPVKFYFKNGIFFESEDGTFKGQIGGRIQHDSMTQSADDDVETAAGDADQEQRFRRARLFIKGWIDERFEFKIEGDFVGGNSRFADVYLRLKDFPFSDTTFGHFKEPVGLEQQMSAGDLLMMERSLPNFLVPGRSAGLMVNGTFAEMFGTYAIGIFRDTDESGDSSDFTPGSGVAKDNHAVTARATYTFLFDPAGNMVLQAGFSYSDRSETEFNFDIDFGLDSDNLSTTSTSPLLADSVDILSFEALFMIESFLAIVEYVRMTVDEPAAGDTDFTAYSVTMSYIVTGERRPHIRERGTVGGVRPNHNAFGKDADGIGAIEVVVRIDFLDLDDNGLPLGANGEYQTIMVGVNWYANGNVKIMLNLGTFSFDNGTLDGDGEEAGVRVEFSF